MNVISYGGGVQSTALIVLAVHGEIDADVALFSNVGDDSESPGTVNYVRNVATPWAGDWGFDVVEVQRRPWPTGSARTLLSYLHSYDGCQSCGATFEDDCYPSCESTRNTGGDLPIPLKVAPSMAPVQRSCTKHWKITPIREWLAANGATERSPANVLIGISTDEMHRATTKARHPIERAAYPLLELGLSRNDCRSIISDAGLPVPPKSTCWFCPFHSETQLSERRRDDPEMFIQQVELEEHLNRRRINRKLAPVQFLASKPLRDVVPAQETLFGDGVFNDGGCDDGYCWT